MNSKTRYLVGLVQDTADIFCSRKPEINVSYDTICIYWPIPHDAEQIFNMFESKKEMNDYLQVLRKSFAESFKKYELLINEGIGPTYTDDNIYACIYLEYQPILKNRIVRYRD